MMPCSGKRANSAIRRAARGASDLRAGDQVKPNLPDAFFHLTLVGGQPRRAKVRLEQPNRAIRIIAQKLSVFGRAEIASPDNARTVDVSRIVDPLLECVRRPVTHEHEMLSRNSRELLVDRNASLGIALIDRVPGFVTDH